MGGRRGSGREGERERRKGLDRRERSKGEKGR